MYYLFLKHGSCDVARPHCTPDSGVAEDADTPSGTASRLKYVYRRWRLISLHLNLLKRSGNFTYDQV
jgi:hypothetical protein